MSRPDAAPVVEPLRTIPQVARQAQVHPRTLRRKLLRIHAKHGGAWLQQKRERGKYEINLSLLRAAHPELFTHKAATREEVAELREDLEQMRKRYNSLEYRLRKFREQANQWFKRGTNADSRGQSDPSP